MRSPASLRSEFAGGTEAAAHGITSAVGPLIVFWGVLGAGSVSAGYWAALVTGVLVCALPLLLRGHPSLVGGSRPASLAVYAGLVLQLCNPAQGTMPTAQQLAIGLAAGSVMLAVASLIVLACGLMRLGNLFRMIPAPVSAGIANGTALILLSLGLKQLTSGGWSAALVCAAMVLGYAAWLRLQKRRPGGFDAMPAVVVGIALGIVAFALIGGAAVDPNTPATVPSGSWQWAAPLLWRSLDGADWRHLLYFGVAGAATLALVITLETFTTAATLENRFGVRVHHNREMVVLGLSNLASALLGGVPSCPSPARSVANWLAGGRGRAAYGTYLAITAFYLVGLAPWLVAMPPGIVAGLLVLQCHVVADPSSRAHLVRMLTPGKSPGKVDLGLRLVLAISLIGFFGNLVWASFAGIAMSSLAVLRRVSRDMTARWEYLDRYRSRRMRSAGEEHLFERSPHRVAVLRLAGHLFFGNSFRIGQLADEIHPDARAVVIELSQVVDADASGTAAVERLVRALTAAERVVMLAGLPSIRSQQLRDMLAGLPGLRQLADLDRGLEACEDEVLMHATVMAAPTQPRPASENRLLAGLEPGEITTVLLLGESRKVDRREWLFRKGDPSNGVWLLEEGAVNVYADMDDASARLAAFAPGQFLGEMSLIDGQPRSATVRAETPVRALLLTPAAFAALLERQPEAALKIMRNISREMSLRIRSTTALLAPSSNVRVKLPYDDSGLGTL